MEERLDFIVAEKRRAGGIGLAVLISFFLHAGLLIFFIRSYRPAVAPANVPMARYVELIKQNPEHTEAPGPEIEKAPSLTAPLSDANRRASTPNPTGDQPTKRPGDGSGGFTPPANPAPPAPQQRGARPMQQGAQQPLTLGAPTAASAPMQSIDSDRLTYREPAKAAAAAMGVDWKNAIREAGKMATAGGDGLPADGGGEKGYAESGPLSFETQWYDWGPYAQSMVSRIRVNWYANMPQIIRTGMQGNVTIRFTIQRDGRITDITVLKSSGVPPYDFAARKAIELSSPLQALPKDFPNPTERVTCIFYYNMPVPAG